MRINKPLSGHFCRELSNTGRLKHSLTFSEYREAYFHWDSALGDETPSMIRWPLDILRSSKQDL